MPFLSYGRIQRVSITVGSECTDVTSQCSVIEVWMLPASIPNDRRSVSFRPGTHYPHVTWAHMMLCVRLGCERRFNIESYAADSHFCHSAYVTWFHVDLWLAHVWSRDVSRVREGWICGIEFNVKSPLTSQPRAQHHMSSRDVRIVVSPA